MRGVRSFSVLEEATQLSMRLKDSTRKSVTNASETIDEVLYGENGAWRRSDQS